MVEVPHHVGNSRAPVPTNDEHTGLEKAKVPGESEHMAGAHAGQSRRYRRRHCKGIHGQRPCNSKKRKSVQDYEAEEIMISPNIVFSDFTFVVAGEEVNDADLLQGNR